MSANYTVRQKAQEDVASIWLYTAGQWGEEQADRYLKKIRDKFEWLADNPRAGQRRKDIDPDIYGTPVGIHLILYDVIDEQPDIIAVIHQSSDVKNWLKAR